MRVPKRRLGEVLVGAGLVSPEQLERAIELQRSTGRRLGNVIIEMGLLDEERLARVLAQELGYRFVPEREIDVRPDVVNLINEQAARRYRAVPLERRGQTIVLAMADPQNVFALDDVAFITRCEVEPVVTTEAGIDRAIYLAYKRIPAFQRIQPEGSVAAKKTGVDEVAQAVRDKAGPRTGAARAPGEEAPEETPLPWAPGDRGPGAEAAFADIEAELSGAAFRAAEGTATEAVDEPPIVRLVDMIINQAVEQGATDIHVEPDEDFFRVRYRIDGILREVMNRPMQLHAPTTSRIKIMASMDISERRLPQDGRIQLRDRNRDVDLRVSTIPTIFGEKLVLRILDKRRTITKLDNLGIEPDDLAKLREAIARPHGIILATGPTGSGKTTTLMAALRELNGPEKNIVTLEDPVEYQIPGINQVQVSEKIGLTFARGLRAFVRQDPEIIMVGEIRDAETAEIAVRSALTGHLVLSTIHTNDAVGSVSRLLDMGIEPYLLASTLVAVLAQRLVRTLCVKCRIPIDLPDDDPIRMTMGLGPGPITAYESPGCPACGGTGFRGRMALFEILHVTPPIRELLSKRASAQEIAREAHRGGMRRLVEDGVLKALRGLTTLREVQRVTYSDDAAT